MNFLVEIMTRKIARIIFLSIIIISCRKSDPEPFNYRQEMRNFVQNINHYARSYDAYFILIPQNGIELILNNPETPGDLNQAYLAAIDGVGQEELYYGYFSDDLATPVSVTNSLNLILEQAVNVGKTVMVTDYCSSMDKMGNSYNLNNSLQYISFSADSRQLDDIPYFPKKPYKVNSSDILKPGDAKNFLYLINSGLFENKSVFLDSLSKTNFDILLMDLFFNDGSPFSSIEIEKLKTKANGGQRLVIGYMAIGEAENYRYYWKNSWESNPPEWLVDENPYWPGNFLVKYWYPEWQSIIYGNDNSYTKRAIDAGFDGLYLDLVDSYQYFE